MANRGIITLAETNKAITLRGFFISTLLTSYRPFCQLNTFGAKVPVITFARRETPTCRFLVSATESNVVTGLFSFPGRDKVKEFFTVSDWQEEVYHAHLQEKNWAAPDWRKVRKEVLKRDNYTCQRCGGLDKLTVHHILPRALGGRDNPENLIALCSGCHDQVEILGYRSQWQIMNQFDNEDSVQDEREVSDEWQGWVYGAKRRPRR